MKGKSGKRGKRVPRPPPPPPSESIEAQMARLEKRIDQRFCHMTAALTAMVAQQLGSHTGFANTGGSQDGNPLVSSTPPLQSQAPLQPQSVSSPVSQECDINRDESQDLRMSWEEGAQKRDKGKRPIEGESSKKKKKSSWYTKVQTTTFSPVFLGVNPATPNMICGYCGKRHGSRPCRMLTGACFRCGRMGHRVKDCPHPKVLKDHS